MRQVEFEWVSQLRKLDIIAKLVMFNSPSKDFKGQLSGTIFSACNEIIQSNRDTVCGEIFFFNL